MLDYTTFRIAQHEHGELARRRPVTEGIRVEEVGILRRGLARLGGMLAKARPAGAPNEFGARECKTG